MFIELPKTEGRSLPMPLGKTLYINKNQGWETHPSKVKGKMRTQADTTQRKNKSKQLTKIG
jgi:hypothetical protein